MHTFRMYAYKKFYILEEILKFVLYMNSVHIAGHIYVSEYSLTIHIYRTFSRSFDKVTVGNRHNCLFEPFCKRSLSSVIQLGTYVQNDTPKGTPQLGTYVQNDIPKGAPQLGTWVECQS